MIFSTFFILFFTSYALAQDTKGTQLSSDQSPFMPPSRRAVFVEESKILGAILGTQQHQNAEIKSLPQSHDDYSQDSQDHYPLNQSQADQSVASDQQYTADEQQYNVKSIQKEVKAPIIPQYTPQVSSVQLEEAVKVPVISQVGLEAKSVQQQETVKASIIPQEQAEVKSVFQQETLKAPIVPQEQAEIKSVQQQEPVLTPVLPRRTFTTFSTGRRYADSKGLKSAQRPLVFNEPTFYRRPAVTLLRTPTGFVRSEGLAAYFDPPVEYPQAQETYPQVQDEAVKAPVDPNYVPELKSVSQEGAARAPILLPENNQEDQKRDPNSSVNQPSEDYPEDS